MKNKYNKAIAAILIVIVCFSLNGCILQGTGGLSSRPSHPIGEQGHDLTWGADAFPGYACPADNITLQWNVGDPQCPVGMGPSCQTLTVDDNLGLLTPNFTSPDLAGQASAGSVSSLASWGGRSPAFSFSVTHDDPNADLIFGWDDRLSQVEIIQTPGHTIEKVFRPGSACNQNPTSCKWRLDQYRLDMKDQSFINSTRGLGGCVRVTSICYRPIVNTPGEQRPHKIAISVIDSGETRLLGEIEFLQCIENISLGPDLEYIVQPVDDPGVAAFPEQGRCCEGSGPGGSLITPQPFIQLLFTLGCDTVSEECSN
jgi:hypothetical protein